MALLKPINFEYIGVFTGIVDMQPVYDKRTTVDIGEQVVIRSYLPENSGADFIAIEGKYKGNIYFFSPLDVLKGENSGFDGINELEMTTNWSVRFDKVIDGVSIADGGDIVFSTFSGTGDPASPTSTAYATNTITLHVNPAPEVEKPASITVGNVTQGESVVISWGAVSGASNYLLQRSVNGGAFEGIFIGTETSYTDTAGTDWTTVQYRVKSTVDGEESDWTTSDVKTVMSAPAPSASARLEQFQNSAGEIIYPQTIVEGVFRKSDGKTLAELLEGTEKTPGVPDGGTAGQVLAKKTNADLDTEWIDPPDSGTDIVLPLSIENGGTGAADAKTALSALIDGSESQFPSTYYTDMYLPISVNGVCYKVPFTSIQKWTVGDRGSSVSQDNTSYGSFIARGIAAGTTDYVAGSTPMVNGTIYLVYE